MAEAKPLKIQRGDKSLDRANRVVATHIIFHTRRKKARLIPAHPGLEGTIRHTESYTALHKRLGSCPASALHPDYACHIQRLPLRTSFMLVISIQSQVVHGNVGNSAAAYAMQAEGVNVAAVPTTLLSNHPRYPTLRGRVLDAELVADLLRGVEERDLVDEAAVLVTGYLGSPDNAVVIADFVERALSRNSKLVYLCDPVIGDDGRVYVADGILDVLRHRLLPAANLITPNQFELE